MSEPSSLYARVHLSEAAWAAYQQSLPLPPRAYTDWQAWLVTQSFYGTLDDQEIATFGLPEGKTCGTEITDWVNSADMIPTISQYDAAKQTWTFVIGECSENYADFIEVLAFLRGVVAFKDLPDDDFILIWSYFWGDEQNAYMVLEQGASRFEAEIPAGVLDEANAAMKALVDAAADAASDNP